MSGDLDPAGRESWFRALEQVHAVRLPRGAFTVLRLDGWNFHRFTRGLVKPFDPALTDALLTVAQALCATAQGARLAYVQSDEVSLVLTDRDGSNAQPWFGGSLQKLTSVTASLAAATFAREFADPRGTAAPVASFDARALSVADADDVLEYLRWRQTDAVRNSISMAAHAVLPHRETVDRPTHELRALLLERGVDWDDYHDFHRRGAFVHAERVVADVAFVDRRTGVSSVATGVRRWSWQVDAFDLRDDATRAALARKLTRSTVEADVVLAEEVT